MNMTKAKTSKKAEAGEWDLFSPKEIADALGVDRATVYRHWDSLPGFRTVVHRRKFRGRKKTSWYANRAQLLEWYFPSE